jgi:aldehyde:ferredoxin oxidoreductase
LFNARLGISRKDDNLPDRLTKVKAPLGPSAGEVVELDMMLDEYYTERGWDLKTGLPLKETLKRLGLSKDA